MYDISFCFLIDNDETQTFSRNDLFSSRGVIAWTSLEYNIPVRLVQDMIVFLGKNILVTKSIENAEFWGYQLSKESNWPWVVIIHSYLASGQHLNNFKWIQLRGKFVCSVYFKRKLTYMYSELSWNVAAILQSALLVPRTPNLPLSVIKFHELQLNYFLSNSILTSHFPEKLIPLIGLYNRVM